MPTGTLPAEGKKLWESVYDKALKGSCKGDQKCAAGNAWKAVKNAGWRKVGDKWVKKSILSEFSLRIERASYDKATNSRRWRAVASDTDEDSRGDNMSLELFYDFIERIKSNEPVPEEFRSDFWSGGMPYISVSHYSDLNGQGVPGDIEAVYIDGNRLKSKGSFHDTVLGRRCFEAITQDLYGVNKGNFDKVRISIAFLDWMHKHKGNGYIFERQSIYDVCPECIRESIEETEPQGKIFLRGHLIHEALTRVPINRRTSMEVDKSMAGIRTRKEDAASIIGEDEAELLDEVQAKIGKSQALVEFSETEDEPIEELDAETAETDLEIPETIEDEEPVLETESVIEEKATKKEGGCNHPSSHFLVVEDASKPTTWHLRVKGCGGKLDHRLMGAAKAALTSPGGHRGNPYEGPNKSQAISKLKRLYKQEGLDWEGKSEIEEMSYDENESVTAHLPFGGATSMKEAIAAEEGRKEYWRLSDLWYMFQGVMSNIFNSDEEDDKTKAMKKCVDEFQSMIEAKSLAILSNLEEFVLKSSTSTPEPITTPIDAPITDLVNTFSDVSVKEIPVDEKLILIQQSYATLGEKIIEAIRSTAKPVAEESQTPVVDNSQINQLADAVTALSNKFDLLMAKMSDASKTPSGPRVPERRSIQPEPFNPMQNMSVTNPGKPISISEFARRSVGLDQ